MTITTSNSSSVNPRAICRAPGTGPELPVVMKVRAWFGRS